MFGLGAWEVIIIFALALIVLGPQKLPELAKQLAKLMGELRRVADDVRSNIEEVTREAAPPSLAELIAKQSASTTPAPLEGVAVGGAGDVQPQDGAPASVAADISVAAVEAGTVPPAPSAQRAYDPLATRAAHGVSPTSPETGAPASTVPGTVPASPRGPTDPSDG